MLSVDFVGRSEDKISWFLVAGEKHRTNVRRHYGLDNGKLVDGEQKPLPGWELDSIRPLIEAAIIK